MTRHRYRRGAKALARRRARRALRRRCESCHNPIPFLRWYVVGLCRFCNAERRSFTARRRTAVRGA